MRLKKGFLVAFEGIDGAGKTTQANLLYETLRKRELDVILEKEPTHSIYGLRIKRLAQGERDSVKPEDEYRLFINDRKIHVENVIRPALQKKKIVILDRYYFSTIAYQGALGLDPERIKSENESFAPIPEIVFLIKVPPKVGLIRIQKQRNEVPNLFEREDYLRKVKEVFESIKENYIVPLEGVGDESFIHNQVMNVMNDVVDHYLKKEDQYTLFKAKLRVL
jgi:dTMP kinase